MITVQAPGKINLLLEVLGKRPDGYHDIRSILVPVSLCDTMTFEVTGGEIAVAMDVADVPATEGVEVAGSDDNLASRAARLLRRMAGIAAGVRIGIHKKVPIGGGLGGGSSNAATALVVLNELWDLRLPRGRLQEASAELGCDVPAFVHGGAVCMEGVGNRISSVWDEPGKRGIPGWWLVLANPGFSVSTGDIYQRFKNSRLTQDGRKYINMRSALVAGDVEFAARNLLNDLEPIVTEKYPLERMLVERLLAAGALGAQVSGSGSSVFGLARDEAHAREIERRFIDSMGMPLWTRVVRTLPDGVMAAHGPLEARV